MKFFFCLKRGWIPFLLFAVVCACFYPTVNHEFVNWDDDLLLEENPNYRGLDKQKLLWMFTTFQMGHYQPITWISYAIDYSFWGMNPFGYHLTNVLIHAINAVLLYFLILKILKRFFPEKIQENSLSAILGTLLYALHPLRVETVAWVTERRDVLSCLFYLVTLLCYIQYVEKKEKKDRSSAYHFLAIFFLLLSLLSKAWAITLPFLLILFDLFIFDRLRLFSWKRLLWEKTPYFLISISFAYLAFYAQKSVGAMVDFEQLPFLARLIQACYGINFYLVKFFIPYPLSHLYPYTANSPWSLAGMVSVFSMFFITACCVMGKKKFYAFFLSWVCYIIILCPVLGFTQSGPQVVADRYTYISFIPLTGWISYIFMKKQILSYKFVFFIFFPVLGLYSLMTISQISIWKNSYTLWNHAVSQEQKNYTAHYKLAEIYYKKNNIDQAVAHAEKCLEIAPNHWKAHKALAEIYLAYNHYPKAIYHFEKAAQSKPIAKNFLNLAKGYIFDNQKAKAIKVLEYSLSLESYAPSHYTLATLYLEASQNREAIHHYNLSLSLDPKQKTAYKYLAMAYYREKDYHQAIFYSQKALKEGVFIEREFLEKLSRQ